MAQPGVMILKEGREKPIQQFHPWVFSGSVDQQRTNMEGVQPGDVIDVRDFRGGFLGRGYWNPDSAIRVRILTWDQTEALGAGWWRIKLAQTIAARERWALREDIDAYRIANAESDGLPGLIVDRYGDWLVVQFLTLGVEVMKDAIVKALADLAEPAGIYERSDVDVRELEGLDESTGVLWGDAPPEQAIIHEHGIQYPVDMYGGHKTGFYLDQKDSRRWLLNHPAVAGSDVLNGFCYSGSFSVCAAKNGAASITNVDSSQGALDLARQAMTINDLNDVPVDYVAADVFEQLRVYRDEERTFDLIILDPPKFAHSKRQVEAAARGYKDINWLAFQLLNPGGLLVTFSCSGQVDADLFQKIVFGASADADVQAQILQWFAQPADHPVALGFPEGRYLKGLACKVMG